MEINERLKIMRKTLNLTQTQLGERIGVTDGAISHIEKGKRVPTKQLLFSICREFRINEEWLFNGKGEMLCSTSTSSDNFEIEISEVFKKITETQKRILIELANEFHRANTKKN